MRTMIGFIFATACAAQTVQPAPPLPEPLLSTVGVLRCGLRKLSTTSVQSWCHALEGRDWKLVHNTITTVTKGRAVVLGYAHDTGDQILWIVDQLERDVKWRAVTTNASGGHGTTPPNYTEGIFSLIDLPNKPTLARKNCGWFCCVGGMPIPESTVFVSWPGGAKSCNP